MLCFKNHMIITWWLILDSNVFNLILFWDFMIVMSQGLRIKRINFSFNNNLIGFLHISGKSWQKVVCALQLTLWRQFFCYIHSFNWMLSFWYIYIFLLNFADCVWSFILMIFENIYITIYKWVIISFSCDQFLSFHMFPSLLLLHHWKYCWVTPFTRRS
jgi:hypothetical protein